MVFPLAPALRRSLLSRGATSAFLHRSASFLAGRTVQVGLVQSLRASNVQLSRTRWQSTAAAPATVHFTGSAEDELAFGEGDGEDRPAPTLDTLQGKVSEDTLKGLRDMGITRLSPVQEAVFSHLPALAVPISQRPEGSKDTRDLLVKARTGTGKTLGFLVPAIEMRKRSIEAAGAAALKEATNESDTRLRRQAERSFARGNVGTLIISPTRELATQIAAEAIKATKYHGMEVRLFTGGANKRMQMRDFLRGRRDIVVATPGRLRDLLTTEPDMKAAFAKMDLLVLDETDTVLEIGFRDDLDAISEYLPTAEHRQTLLYSATVPRNVQQVARNFMHKQHEVIDCIQGDAPPVHAHVPQYFTLLPSARDQIPHLLRLIAHDQMTNPGHSKVVVFFPTLKLTQLFATILRSLTSKTTPAGRATRVHELHSKMTQAGRDKASQAFRSDTSGAAVMVTSDVSARGVDYPNVSRVIQVSIPSSKEQYIHRVGRTGRAGSKGVNPRGDLVLHEWEGAFATWELADIPIKPTSVDALKDEVADLASKFDAGDLQLPSELRRSRLAESWTEDARQVVDEIETATQQLLRRVDEIAVRDTFVSMIGFYSAKVEALRTSRDAVVEALRAWTVDAMGLAQPPYVSPSFLQRIGMGDTGKKSSRGGGYGSGFGQPRERSTRRGDGPRLSKPWTGRGRPRSDEHEDRGGYEGRRESRGYEGRRERREFDGGRREYRDRDDFGGKRERRNSYESRRDRFDFDA
ncbi:P-loop containing nucleoside triphosphate hydrolase protein [Schizophyllum commune]